MDATTGSAVAFATGSFEIHLADDGLSAVAFYRFSDIGTTAHTAMLELLESMGFMYVDESGWTDADAQQQGLSGLLEWDMFLA